MTKNDVVLDNGITIRRKSIEDFSQNPDNPVVHPERNKQVVGDSIKRFGAGRSGLARDGVMLAGNLTIQQMAAQGITDIIEVTVPDGGAWVVVNRPDLSDAEAAALVVADQRSAELGGWDTEKLKATAAKVDISSFWSPDEIAAKLGSFKMPAAKAGDYQHRPMDVPVSIIDDQPQPTTGVTREERSYKFEFWVTLDGATLIDAALKEAALELDLQPGEWLLQMAGAFLRNDGPAQKVWDGEEDEAETAN